jgi:hypothetical protein
VNGFKVSVKGLTRVISVTRIEPAFGDQTEQIRGVLGR